MTELKPCPFCGNKAEDRIDHSRGRDKAKLIISIECKQCGIIKRHEAELSYDAKIDEYLQAFDTAMKAWNMRWSK